MSDFPKVEVIQQFSENEEGATEIRLRYKGEDAASWSELLMMIQRDFKFELAFVNSTGLPNPTWPGTLHPPAP
jgi:hypothetical protein